MKSGALFIRIIYNNLTAMPRLVSVIFVMVLMAVPVSLFAEGQKEQQMKEVAQIESVSLSVSEMTGVAINPLLVTTAIGIHRNIKAGSAEARGQLPWYFQTWFIVICGLFVLLSYLISIPSIAFNIPPQVSSFIEQFNKIIGFVIATPVIYDIITPISGLMADNVQAALSVSDMYVYASVVPVGFLEHIPGIVWNVMTTVMMLFVYAAIWLMNITFDAAIFICPFGWVDTALKTVRAAYFAFLVILSAIYPPLAFIITLPVIIIAVLLFGWSIRRFVRSFVFLTDFLSRRKEDAFDARGILAFSEQGFSMPSKRMGRLTEQDGKWVFTYQKGFFFEKTITADKAYTVLKKGFICSDIRNGGKLLCSLPPRYQKVTEQVQDWLHIDKRDEGKIKRGLKAAGAWIKNLFRRNRDLGMESA